MASGSSKRRRGGHPAKVAERRERERARREGAGGKSALERAVSAACGEALGLGSAFDAELWASALLGSWWPPSLEMLRSDDPEFEVGAPLVEAIAQRENAAAVAALLAIGAVSESELGVLALGRANQLLAAGVPGPAWATAILDAEILGTAVMRESVFDDGCTIFIEASHGDGERHAVGVYIDNNLGVMAKDILLAESIERVGEVLAANPESGGELRLEPIGGAEAGARIRAAMELTDTTLGAPVGEDYAALRSLALLRADSLPGGEVDVDIPELDDADRQRLLADFLASPEGAGVEADTDASEAVRLAIDFCAGYVDGRPLRWSPVVVELFMADWLPRKLLADRAMFEAVPSALDAWVRYAGRVRGIPDWAIATTLDAIPRWAGEMLEGVSDGSGGGGPAKEFLAAAKAAGVDVSDDEALSMFIAGWNARSDAD